MKLVIMPVRNVVWTLIPPARRKAPFCNPSASDMQITNIPTLAATGDALAVEAITIRITSIPMAVARGGLDVHILSRWAISTLREIPIRKEKIAKRCSNVARPSRAAALIASNTKLPVTCPVNVFARTKLAASPYPPTKASPNASHASLCPLFEFAISLGIGIGALLGGISN
jgi:hypothetical protein